jgi:hypothetical protein
MAGTARERAIAGIAEPVDMKDIAEHASDQRAQVQYQAGPLLDENAPIEAQSGSVVLQDYFAAM